MGFVDHLKGADTNSLTLEMAFGRHVIEGDLAKSNVTGTSPSHVVKVQHILGNTLGKGWSGPEGVWFRGVNRPASKYRFHSGLYVPDPAIKAFTANSITDQITITAHGYANGDMLIFRPGSLPAPLVPALIYYVRDSAANTFKLAATSGGSAIDLTTNGSGVLEVYKNHPTQGIDPDWQSDHNHSNTAWISLECPNGSEVGIPDANTKDNAPTGFSGVFKTQLGDIYDESGSVTASSQFLTNPADVLAFGLMEIRKYDSSRIDWTSLDALRTAANGTVTPDYTTLPEGIGLTGRYYDGTSFGTLKSTRIDPVIQFDVASGEPALGLDPDSFSVRWEGKIRPKYSGTYTFYLTHDDGGRLYITDMTTPIIDQWGSGSATHSATVAMTADQFYDIKLEWYESGGAAQFKLEWELTGQESRKVVQQDRLYPFADTQKRFECHVAFPQFTTFNEFLRAVLFQCNGDWQDADGKLTFFCVEDLSPTFAFDESNIKKNTFNYYPRYSQSELLQLPNRYLADGRDLDSRYLEKFDPPLYYDLPELQTTAGRVIEESVSVGNVRRWQGLSNLAHYAKLKSSIMVVEFEGTAATYPVLKGDLVTVSHSIAGWTDKQFLVIEATDKQLPKRGSNEGADDRIFKLLEWTTSGGDDNDDR